MLMNKRLRTHLAVDPNTGMSACGAGPGALPARHVCAVTCLRCRRAMREERRRARAARATCGHFRTYPCRVTDATGSAIINYCHDCGVAVAPRFRGAG